MIQSFKFHVLARTEKENVARPEWSLSVGEAVHSIQVLREQGDRSSLLMVTGSRTLMALTAKGEMVFAKKFDFTPLSSFAFNGDNEKVMSIVASGDSNALVILENTTVKWASKVSFKPLIMARGSFEDVAEGRVVANLLVTVGSSGTLSVSYLGTNPSMSQMAPTLPGRQLDFDSMDEEMSKLNKRIQSLTSSDQVDEIAEPITLSTRVHSLQRCAEVNNEEDEEDKGLISATVVTELKSNTPVTNIRVHVDVEQPLAVDERVVVVPTLSGSWSVVSTVVVESGGMTVHSLELTVTVVYLMNDKTPTVRSTTLTLPLRMAVRRCTAVKEADFKLTIATNRPALPLTDIFDELNLDSSETNAVGLASRVHPSHLVTVLSSKSSQRYRLQSDDLPSLWLLLDYLITKLELLHKGGSGEALKCSYSSSLPMAEFFALVDEHFALRCQETLLKSQLAQRCTQFRAVEKRILAKFKDPTPTSLAHLDLLLQTSHVQVERAIEEVEVVKGDLRRVGGHLVAIARLIVKLVALSSDIDAEEELTLRAALADTVHSDQEQGWEEVSDASLTHLLRTSLAKSGKEQHGATPISLTVAKDTTRLKKHVASVLDRITKGVRMNHTSRGRDERQAMHQTGLDALQEEEDESLPGKRIGELTERLRSARTARSRQRLGQVVRKEQDDHLSQPHPDGDEGQDEDEDVDDVDVDDLLW